MGSYTQVVPQEDSDLFEVTVREAGIVFIASQAKIEVMKTHQVRSLLGLSKEKADAIARDLDSTIVRLIREQRAREESKKKPPHRRRWRVR